MHDNVNFCCWNSLWRVSKINNGTMLGIFEFRERGHVGVESAVGTREKREREIVLDS